MLKFDILLINILEKYIQSLALQRKERKTGFLVASILAKSSQSII